ncbi:hypothetical protein EJ076_08165 [Mesorhizobium sp. M7D.F.Ca.US.005.01.1.1]|uniref:hypothetical protein n=1 Tax=Mesorhizobium sp. M7D.F.Ca.US.005.01.1.1 TaxID=2493678 RepID=UPI000F756C93|nr:hypothetical protein [Mesorhizobium sp. M7D.F.Ca.US.005.01.1.1]AZO41109.1 hypothetical protein EJ076_08165 [Mesorhizobium sp. M7D.F.Ca.US.005.01.1.1]
MSGKEIISESTEKTQNRLMFFSSAAILAKSYDVPLSDMKLLGIEFPASVFDVTMFVLVSWYTYTFILKWIGDLAGFRLWYNESSIWSTFGTHMKLDKSFISGGLDLMKALHQLDKDGKTPSVFAALDEKTKQLYTDFNVNVELYAARLGAAGAKFSTLSKYGHFYVWVQHFLLPISLAIFAGYLLVKYGTFSIPPHM